MDRRNTLVSTADDRENKTPTADKVEQLGRDERHLARNARLLAALVTAAVLVSGLNALLQVARVFIEWKAGR